MRCGYAAGAVANVNGLQVRPTADLAPEAIGCFTPGTGHIWGRASGTWNNLDGDRNAPGYDETQISFTVGADYAFTDSFYAGIAGGWISSEMDFDNFGRRRGASIDYEGWHVAGYGGYDNRVFYLRGIVDFASYDGETHRDIQDRVPALVDPSSDEADSDVFDFYGEAGYRWEFSPNYTFTPFVGVDVGHAELDDFSEKDPHDTGWALKVKGGDADSVETLVGVRFGGFWDMAGGMFRPEVMVAWAHEFDDPAEVDMAFRDAPDAKFTVVASDVADRLAGGRCRRHLRCHQPAAVRHQVGRPVQRGLRLAARSSVGWNTSSDPTARLTINRGSPMGSPDFLKRVASGQPFV